MLGVEAGFDAIWSSGLELSASRGVPDADILTMSDTLAAADKLAESVACPVLADCDAGYGGVNNVYRMVELYERAGVAAVCIEDKRYPKINSLFEGRQELEDVDVFAAKLRAAQLAKRDPDLMVIARLESLVAGGDLADAFYRAEAYEEAGADALLIHDKVSSPARVLAFLSGWRERSEVPLVVVPTTYFHISATELAAAGANIVIYANHGLRSAIHAMRQTFTAILESDSTAAVEARIAPLADVFDLQRISELDRRERELLPSTNQMRGGQAILASHGNR
jgi:phosphoenolpyruvate phosphomutase